MKRSVQYDYPLRQSRFSSLFWLEGFLEKVGFAPGVKECGSNKCWLLRVV